MSNRFAPFRLCRDWNPVTPLAFMAHPVREGDDAPPMQLPGPETARVPRPVRPCLAPVPPRPGRPRAPASEEFPPSPALSIASLALRPSRLAVSRDTTRARYFVPLRPSASWSNSSHVIGTCQRSESAATNASVSGRSRPVLAKMASQRSGSFQAFAARTWRSMYALDRPPETLTTWNHGDPSGMRYGFAGSLTSSRRPPIAELARRACNAAAVVLLTAPPPRERCDAAATRVSATT